MAIDDTLSAGMGLPGGDAAELPDDPVTSGSPAGFKRERKTKLKIDKAKIARRVIDFFKEDDQDRNYDLQARVQRYAKYRMWQEGKDWPWEDSSDAAIPDMMTHSQKVQDTLHNAVMSTRPAVIAKALQKANNTKEDRVNSLLDYQFFIENKGENLVSEMCDAFVNDGVMTVFVPWIKDEREVHEIHTVPGLKSGENPETHCATFLKNIYQGKIFRKTDKLGWSWEVLGDTKDPDSWFDVEFYTVGDVIEMDAVRRVEIFNAPCPMVKDYEDVLTPARCANLQIPSPSNPGGASHVIVVDYPTVDEIKRLYDAGYYDLIDDKDIEKIEKSQQDTTTPSQALKEQRDNFQGVVNNPSTNDGAGEGKTQDHKSLTRLTCFDIFDTDGDGKNEDVIFTVLLEVDLLLRVRELTQVYPANPPRRPFAETTFIPVRGSRTGISLLEMMEGLHDMIKQFADQTIDSGTLKMAPFFFYRATSSMRPETIRYWPGEGYPLSDPKNDVNFPVIPDNGSAMGFNLMNLFGQMEERLTNIGDLQLGRVPQGKSSALRTVRGMQAVLGQGDARPERILRRFFIGYAEVYAQMHELNQVFLPREKQIRVAGVPRPDEDAYTTISDTSEIRGRFQFDFIANAMNTSKEALQGSLDELMQMYLNPLALQLQVIDADGVYRLLRDAGKARGQEPDKYLKPPSPDSQMPKIFAVEAINLILQGITPEARPAEANPMDHLKALMEFSGKDEFGYLSAQAVVAFKAYLAILRQYLQRQAQQQQLQDAAAQFQSGRQQPGQSGPPGAAPLDMGPTRISNNELVDETLPSAGGGANTGTLQ